MYEDTMKQNQSVIEAYRKMKVAEQEKQACAEDDTGGDPSAYNKYLLGKTGDLPRSKKEYMKVDESDVKKDPCWDGYEMVGMKKKDGKEVPNCVPEKD